MSESEISERRRFEGLIKSLEKNRVPEDPTLFSCGSDAKRIHRIIVKESKRVIQDNEALTTRVVTGAFGSGKTHLARWVEADLFYYFSDNVLVSYVDLKRAKDFPEVICQILLNIRNRSGQNLSKIMSDAYEGHNRNLKLGVAGYIRNKMTEGKFVGGKFCERLVQVGFERKAAEEMARCFVDHRNDIIKHVPKDINSLKTLCNFLVLAKYRGVCIFLDEFESLESKASRVDVLEMLRAMHDDGDSFRSVFLVVLTSPVFWDRVVRKTYSPLYQRWDGERRLELGDLDLDDAKELFQSLLRTYEKAGHSVRHKNSSKVDLAAREIYEDAEKRRPSKPITFRDIIKQCIKKIKKEHWLS